MSKNGFSLRMFLYFEVLVKDLYKDRYKRKKFKVIHRDYSIVSEYRATLKYSTKTKINLKYFNKQTQYKEYILNRLTIRG